MALLDGENEYKDTQHSITLVSYSSFRLKETEIDPQPMVGDQSNEEYMREVIGNLADHPRSCLMTWNTIGISAVRP